MFQLAERGFCTVTSQIPWSLDQYEVVWCVFQLVERDFCSYRSQARLHGVQLSVRLCCVRVFQLAEWGVLHLQAMSQTPWGPAQFELLCCVSVGRVGGSAFTSHEPDPM